ncbi:MAG: MBL fold metallo-hydrolase [Acidobacteria bacterium]|nr:MBL fold metallo-hydrolase [Acidobacteriota bacterium]
MKKISLLSTIIFLIYPVIILSAQQRPAQQKNTGKSALDIYYVDVEGGAATLIVTPAGESILVDAGWPGFDGRDAKRIDQAMKAAGITAIDHMVMTHYHTDHYGGIPELARRVKINKFYDHGPVSSLDEDKDFARKYAAYQEVTRGQSITLKPGSIIALKQASGTPKVSLQCLAARGQVIADKSAGSATDTSGRPTLKPRSTSTNSACSSTTPKPEDKSDNARSVVLLLRYGTFDFLDTGDLTWNIEEKLVCPYNLIDVIIDLYQVAHHGANTSNNPVLLQSIKPTVAIMNNGERKGGHPDTFQWLSELPSLKTLWQVHRSTNTEKNAPPEFIANLEEKDDSAHMIRVSVDPGKGSFTVTNDRTGKQESYQLR